MPHMRASDISDLVDVEADESDGNGSIVESDLSDLSNDEDDVDSLKSFIVPDEEDISNEDSTMLDVTNANSTESLFDESHDLASLNKDNHCSPTPDENKGPAADLDGLPGSTDSPASMVEQPADTQDASSIPKTAKRSDDSAEEDPSVLTKDDKMFSDSRGVKSSLLPKGLTTRSAAKNTGLSADTETSDVKVIDNPPQKIRKIVYDTDPKSTESEHVSNPSYSRNDANIGKSKKKTKSTSVQDGDQDHIAHCSDIYEGSIAALIESLLSQIMPAINQAIAPVRASQTAPAQSANVSSPSLLEGHRPIPDVDVVASAVVLLKPSLMDASPSQDNKLESSKDIPTSDQSAVASASAGPKIRKLVLPGLEGMFSPTTNPTTYEDSKDLFDGAIVMDSGGVFLEDLEQYKRHYDGDYPCGVFDIDLQDPLLQDSYKGRPPLPNRTVVPTYNPNQNSVDPDEKGGRIRFSIWPKSIKECSPLTISEAVTFSHAGFENRKSEYALNVQTSDGIKVGVCVSAGMCTASHVVDSVKVHGPLQRDHKYINLMMHNQDWERWAAFVCLCFGRESLYANMTDLAIQISTLMSKAENDQNARSELASNIHPDIMSPIKKTNGSTPGKKRTDYVLRYALACDDTVPVYDARNKDIDFEEDLPNLDDLPRWKGEVPIGSFVVVGYTVNTYQSSRVRNGPKEEHVSCNLMWIVVCGIPKNR
ncbi:hypothetical protein B0H13DRAFT_2327305 [Mycena leptocephala]|nr:hypothetical protein B0H13DRAFT_2327305 [Mycena leptocephala]